MAAAQDAFGRLDIVVSGAAPHDAGGTVAETSIADWERVVAVNLTGSFLLCRAALPLMIASGGGSIILIASQLGRVGSAGRAAYCATKGALIQLAKVMAIDHAADNIRVNALSPGAVETERLTRRYGSFEAARDRTRPQARAGAPRPAGGDCRGGGVSRRRRFALCHRQRSAGRWRLHRDLRPA